MGVKKLSIALDENVAASAALAAEEAGQSLSAWLNDAAKERLRIFEGRRAVEEIWADIGRPTPEEEAWAEAKLQETMAGIEAIRRRRAEQRGSPE